jgi:uncharacterized damage-inducible protein DinB
MTLRWRRCRSLLVGIFEVELQGMLRGARPGCTAAIHLNSPDLEGFAFAARCGYALAFEAMARKAKTRRLTTRRKGSRTAKRSVPEARLAELCVRQWRSRFEERYLPRIVGCLEQLSDEEIWWRPNEASNSIGNLVLHVCGNMRQWIISGLGGPADVRERDKEFSERGPITRAALREKLQRTVSEACDVLARLRPSVLTRHFRIQGYDVTGYEAAAQVIEHVAYHLGQIIYVTKLKRAKDLGFTQLPSTASKADERKL